MDTSTIVETTRSRRSSGGPSRGPILVQSLSHSGTYTVNPTDDSCEQHYQARLHEDREILAPFNPTSLDSSISNGNDDLNDQNATMGPVDNNFPLEPPTEILSGKDTIEMWTQRAIESFKKTERKNVISKALSLLFSQKGKLDISVIEFTNLKLTHQETIQLMQTYAEHPSRDSDQRDEPLQLVTGMSTLMGYFSKNDVKAFILFSKRFANKDIPLSSLTEEESRDTITRILKQKAKYIGLSEDEADNWLSWHHTELAKWFSRIWSSSSEVHTTLLTILENCTLDLSHPDFHILNQRFEQEQMLKLFQIFQYQPEESLKDPSFQLRAVKALLKKMPDKNIYKKKILDLFTKGHPKLTIDDFRNAFLEVRETARRGITEAIEYGCIPPPDTKSYKTKLTGQGYNQRTVTDTVHRDSKRLKSENYTPTAFDPNHHCWICGMNNHLKNACFLTKTEHPDRNTEDKPFHQSNKGKLWQSSDRGPFVLPNFLLDGDTFIKKLVTKPQAHTAYQL
jgi:hypothetical protein